MDAEDGGLMPAKTREGGLRPKTWKEPEDGRRVPPESGPITISKPGAPNMPFHRFARGCAGLEMRKGPDVGAFPPLPPIANRGGGQLLDTPTRGATHSIQLRGPHKSRSRSADRLSMDSSPRERPRDGPGRRRPGRSSPRRQRRGVKRGVSRVAGDDIGRSR